MSSVSQSKPARAMKRAAVMLPSDSQVPTAGLPSFNSFFTEFDRIMHSLVNSSKPDAQRGISKASLAALRAWKKWVTEYHRESSVERTGLGDESRKQAKKISRIAAVMAVGTSHTIDQETVSPTV